MDSIKLYLLPSESSKKVIDPDSAFLLKKLWIEGARCEKKGSVARLYAVDVNTSNEEESLEVAWC